MRTYVYTHTHTHTSAILCPTSFSGFMVLPLLPTLFCSSKAFSSSLGTSRWEPLPPLAPKGPFLLHCLAVVREPVYCCSHHMENGLPKALQGWSQSSSFTLKTPTTTKTKNCPHTCQSQVLDSVDSLTPFFYMLFCYHGRGALILCIQLKGTAHFKAITGVMFNFVLQF